MNNELRNHAVLLGKEFEDLEVFEHVIDLNKHLPNGYFSLQLGVSGDGAVSVRARVSNDGVNFVLFDDSELAAAFGADSGPEEDGRELISFAPPCARYLEISFVAAGAVKVTAWYCLQ